MRMCKTKIIAALLLSASLLICGCSKDNSSGADGTASPASDTSVTVSSSVDLSQESKSSSDNKDESSSEKSQTSSENKSSDISSSGTAKTSDKTVKTQSKKTSTAAKTKSQKTSDKTSTQKRTTTVTHKSSKQNVQTNASSKNSKVTAKNEFYVSIEIECKSAVGSKDLSSSVTLPSNGVILSKTDIKVKSGQSALDVTETACEQMGIPIVCLNGSYVSSIGPIGEKQCGKFSGWTYMVNGKKPSKSSDKYILEENDTLIWSYVTTY